MHNFTKEAAKNAKLYNIPVDIVNAIILVESVGDPGAWNPEPHYRWFWNVRMGTPFRTISELESANEKPPKDFPCLAGDPDQEWWAQQASWGLMQCMGAVYRERGYKMNYIPSIIAYPNMQIQFGCMHLAAYHRRWGVDHGWLGVVGAFNAGSPQATDPAYIKKIEKFCPNIRRM